MPTPRCDGCRFWGGDHDNDEWEAKRAGFKECTAIKERWCLTDGVLTEHLSKPGHARLTSEQMTDLQIDAVRKARAFVQDGSQYRAELFTGPDFFCAFFDGKE